MAGCCCVVVLVAAAVCWCEVEVVVAAVAVYMCLCTAVVVGLVGVVLVTAGAVAGSQNAVVVPILVCFFGGVEVFKIIICVFAAKASRDVLYIIHTKHVCDMF